MSVYMIIDIKVHDADKYNEYILKAEDIIKKFGGSYLIRGGVITPVSGNWTPERIVEIEFPSEELYRDCFNSDDYKNIAHLRIESTNSRTILVEGIPRPK